MLPGIEWVGADVAATKRIEAIRIELNWKKNGKIERMKERSGEWANERTSESQYSTFQLLETCDK